jgi:sulfate transport system permease protein
MAETLQSKGGLAAPAHRRGTTEPAVIRWLLIAVALAFALLFLLLPLVSVFYEALAGGVRTYVNSLADPDTLASIRLTLIIAVICVPLNVVFGVAAAWTIAKFEFRGKALLISLIDLPFAVSPVVAGLLFVLLFGAHGWFAHSFYDDDGWFYQHHLKVIFAVPGMVMATLFVTFPFVARELIPVMQQTGSEQEQAALTLGASGWQTFWYVTLPSVKWGLLYGVVLCNARAMGEFGAVTVVSGKIVGLTETMPLRIESLFQASNGMPAAFTLASLLALLALVTLGVKTGVEWKTRREEARGQQVAAPAGLGQGGREP